MNASRILAALVALTVSTAQAHEGHGLPGTSHWHASDTLGWLAVAVIAVVAVAWGRRK
jgi:hypothetical protein